ncbi:phosphatase PAP2 family protein [Yinghuangia sp. ASG 101]|uniref:phosphatase PAP2 family protein n=1 Tax=Yinghuangia sp. ASG 101 TaxID=2896848 RepID=UPI001E4645AD|nr:phosphatase PAP2 family protein [Yinghuangia sp. ASG 101]UGQ08978.1 phosphatase PAP2 family protein [Yinghuangia sp. ASG 101]
MLAIAVTTCAGLVVLPVAWTYELLWLLPAAVGRVGGRPEDRPVWPVLIIVAAAVERDVIDPRLGTSLSAVFGNVPTLVALAAACAVPFRAREDPHWRIRRATSTGLPARRRALLPGKARPVTRPNLLLELMLIRAGYWAYQNIRGDLRVSIPRQREQAIENARHIVRIEEFLHLDIEASVNRFSLRSTRMFALMVDYYRELHYVVPVAVLGWLYVRHPTRYRAARTVLAVTTGLALIGYWLYPLCPPRLLPDSGMVASLPGGPRSYVFAVHLVNPYAAMPSLHIAWALWCGVAVVCVARSRWLKALAVLYPCATCFVVVGTANHWVLDGVGAALALGVAVVVQRALTGRRLRDKVPAFLARLGTAPSARRPGASGPSVPGPRPKEGIDSAPLVTESNT